MLGVLALASLGFGTFTTYWPNARWTRVLPLQKSKTSLALTRSMAYQPEIQHAIAEMAIELESIGPHREAVAEDWSNDVDHGAH